jgi:hypothetical protein
VRPVQRWESGIRTLSTRLDRWRLPDLTPEDFVRLTDEKKNRDPAQIQSPS